MTLLPPLGSSRVRFSVYTALVVVALVAGAWYAGTLAWVSDDAFISFRYAKNLVLGRGLVYNPGERVEGYTNFLWTMMVAAGLRVGLDPVPLSETLSITFHLLTIGLCGWYSWSVHNESRGEHDGRLALPIVPLAALAFAVHRDANVYATSGLETAMFTFLVTLAFVLLVRAQGWMSFVALGCVFVAMLMTRPDGIVFLGAAMLAIVLLGESWVRRLLFLMAPIALLYVPYWCWRYSYYGYPLPNTFYAKSVDAANYVNGLRYLGLYFTSYYAIPAGLALGLLGAIRPLLRLHYDRGALLHRSTSVPEKTVRRGLLVAFVFIAAWLAFITRIGGDFMFARFLIPVTPLFLIAIASLLTFAPPRLAAVVAVLVVVGTFCRYDHFKDRKQLGYIADEWDWYPASVLADNRIIGLRLREHFDGVPLRVAFGGSRCQMMYYADPDLAIECETGLTDAFVAHQHLAVRGRPGHEKAAPIDYLIRRGVNVVLWSKTFPFGTYMSNATFDGMRTEILVYDNAVMSHLAKDSSVTFDDVPAKLDTILASISKYSDSDLKFHYERLMRLYFPQNNDHERQAALETELRRRGILMATARPETP